MIRELFGKSVLGAALVVSGVAMTTAEGMAQGLGSEFDASAAGEKTLTVWWLGNQEVPGIEDWMSESVKLYQEKYPNVTVKTVLQPVDTYNTLQKTACRGGSGPDIWYNWGGTWSLEMVWAGCIVPNEEVLSSSDLELVPSIAGTSFDGKTWIYPFEYRLFPVVYNKDLFKQAGLDPEKPPMTWAEFIADCEKIKAAGITPVVVGLKDGFGGEIASVGLQHQLYTVPELIAMVIDGDFTSDKWKSWIEKVVELKPYVNNDTNSTLLADALNRFEAGEAAMVIASPGYLQTIKSMIEAGKNPGVMKVPNFSGLDLGDQITVDTPGFQVTQFASDKQLAGSFMAFLHNQDRLNGLYAGGTLPIDQRWDITTVVRDTDAKLAQFGREQVAYYSANYYPIDLDVNANFVIFQGILGGDMTVDQAAQTYEDVITKWRSLHAADVELYKTWLKSYQ